MILSGVVCRLSLSSFVVVCRRRRRRRRRNRRSWVFDELLIPLLSFYVTQTVNNSVLKRLITPVCLIVCPLVRPSVVRVILNFLFPLILSCAELDASRLFPVSIYQRNFFWNKHVGLYTIEKKKCKKKKEPESHMKVIGSSDDEPTY